MRSVAATYALLARLTLVFLVVAAPTAGAGRSRAVTAALATSGIVNEFRWLTSVLTPKRRRKLVTKHEEASFYDEEVYSPWKQGDGDNDLVETFTLAVDADALGDDEDEQMAAVVQMAHRVTRSAEVFTDRAERAQQGLADVLCVFELRAWLFGRHVYLLKDTRDGDAVVADSDQPNLVEVEWRTPRVDASGRRGVPVPRTLRLKAQLMLDGDQLKVTVLASSAGVPRAAVGRILRTHAAFWRAKLPKEVEVAAARRRQFKHLAVASKTASAARKKKELDRVAHPEKYRQISPSVRRGAGTGGAGGGGRYTPSSATQARRQVVRGG
jgi:hypothetical protein